MVQDLKTGRRELLVPGIAPVYSPSGHLVYVVFGTSTLWALPFSLDTLKATGEAFLIAQNSRAPTVATDGTLVYRRHLRCIAGAAATGLAQPSWRQDRRDRPAAGAVSGYPTLSPDGRRVAVQAREGSNFDIWVWDITRAVKTRLTKGLEVDGVPLWGPTGKEVAFPSNPAGNFDIYPAAGRWQRRGEGAAGRTPQRVSNRLVPGWEVSSLLARRSGNRGGPLVSGAQRRRERLGAAPISGYTFQQARSEILTRRPLCRLRVGRVGSTGSLCAALSPGRPAVDGVEQRRDPAALEPGRQRAVLCRGEHVGGGFRLQRCGVFGGLGEAPV